MICRLLKKYYQGSATQLLIAAAFLAKLSPILDFNGNRVFFIYFMTSISLICFFLLVFPTIYQEYLENQGGKVRKKYGNQLRGSKVGAEVRGPGRVLSGFKLFSFRNL